MINMFISILKSPAGEATVKNIGAIDMAAGYFAYLDYSTDSIFSFALVNNLAQWARQAVSRASNQVPERHSTHLTAGIDAASPMQDFHVDSIPEVSSCHSAICQPVNLV
jgi:hypothetical protein